MTPPLPTSPSDDNELSQSGSGSRSGSDSDSTPTTPQSQATKSGRTHTAPLAGRSPKAWVLLILVTLAALVTDLVSKEWAFANVAGQPVRLTREAVLAASGSLQGPGLLIPPHEAMVVIPNLLDFTLVLNRGAVFGIGAGKRWFFVAFTLVAVVFALHAFRKWTHANQWGVHTALGLVLGGGLGNLYDRLLFACVRDFIHPLPNASLPFGLRWPGGSTELWPYVSNVADLYLIVGIGVLVVHVWRTPHEGAGAVK